MNILIVSENFLSGGLETHINSTVSSLKEKVNFFYAFKNYNEKWMYENVYTGFYFSYYCTIAEFCHDVDTLVQIIKNNNIDVVHVHPFYSLFPAIFASKICGIPVAYTYHGIRSYNFTCGVNDTLLFNMLLDYEIDKVFCVAAEGNRIFENIMFDNKKITFMPNSIDLEVFKPAKTANNKSWALISRLDDDKINEILKLINILNKIDVKELHIFGDGSKKEFLQNFITEKQLNKKIFLEGHCNNLPEKLSGNFNGVIGIGRAIMEAISMEFPTLLIGYNKIAGIINSDIYNSIKNENFTNKYLPNISIHNLQNQIQEIYNNNYDKKFYKLFKQDFSTQTVSNLYFEELVNINFSYLLNLNDLYNEIKQISNDDTFYESVEIYRLLIKYFAFHIRQPHQKNIFVLGDNLLSQKNFYEKTINHVNTFMDSIEYKISEHEKSLNYLYENSMTLTNLKRKIKHKFNKK